MLGVKASSSTLFQLMELLNLHLKIERISYTQEQQNGSLGSSGPLLGHEQRASDIGMRHAFVCVRIWRDGSEGA